MSEQVVLNREGSSFDSQEISLVDIMKDYPAGFYEVQIVAIVDESVIKFFDGYSGTCSLDNKKDFSQIENFTVVQDKNIGKVIISWTQPQTIVWTGENESQITPSSYTIVFEKDGEIVKTVEVTGGKNSYEEKLDVYSDFVH